MIFLRCVVFFAIYINVNRKLICYMGELSKLPNIGKIVEEQLIKVGINSIEELKK